MRQFWFEKTVEYKYVLEAMKSLTIKPLAGPLEKFFGDAIEGANGIYKLIEFKRTQSEIKEENGKFKRLAPKEDYLFLKQQALTSVGRGTGEVQGHYLVYGVDPPLGLPKPDDNASMFPEVRLWQSNYWNWNIHGKCTPALMRPFLSKELFHSYLKFLLACRSTDSSTGSIGLVEIMADSKVRHVSLLEYIDWHPILKQEIKNLGRVGQEITTQNDSALEAERDHDDLSDDPNLPQL